MDWRGESPPGPATALFPKNPIHALAFRVRGQAPRDIRKPPRRVWIEYETGVPPPLPALNTAAAALYTWPVHDPAPPSLARIPPEPPRMTLTVDTVFTWEQLAARDLSNSIVVVADVLRATTVMVAALANGARAILPQADDAAARGLRTILQGQGVPVLLCGEKDGLKREGYDLGNSPREFERSLAEGKTIVHLTTNGTRALTAAGDARHVLIASLTNRAAAAARVAELADRKTGEVLLVASGKESRFCLEDTVCLGGIVLLLMVKWDDPAKLALTDASEAAAALYAHYHADLLGMLETCGHGRHLKSVGLEDDFPHCAALDTMDIVPEMRNGRVALPHIALEEA